MSALNPNGRRSVVLAVPLFSAILLGAPAKVGIEPPVYFEPDGAAYLVRGLKTGARLERSGTLRLNLPGAGSFSLQFAGANRHVEAEAAHPLPGRTHYFIGRESRKWRTNVPHYGQVRYRNVYPGIDIVYYAKGDALEYDLVVAPGADPRRIRLRVSGVDRVTTEGDDLVIETGGRKLRQAKPRIYQAAAEGRVEIAGRYAIDSTGGVRIEVGHYDPHRPLVIDPVIVWSTLLGGDKYDYISAVAVDPQGNVYVAGETNSANFPGTPPAGMAAGTRRPEAYVSKINPAGTAVLFTAYFAARAFYSAGAAAIALDSAGNIYVTGNTGSDDFPVTSNAAQTRLAGNSDAYLLKLDPSGARILYGTFLGGRMHDYPQAVAVNAAGHAVVAGYTWSTDFPVVAAVRSSAAAAPDAFAFRVDTTTGRLIYSSVFGGSGYDQAYGVALDPAGNAYVAGSTGSKDFPVTPNAYQKVLKDRSAFIVKLNPAGDPFLYATMLGENSWANAIAVDAAGNAYVAGGTGSAGFPTTTLLAKKENASGPFIAKLTPDGSALVYSSPLGAGHTGEVYGVALTPAGEAWATGTVQTLFDPAAFPTVNPTQRAWGGGGSDWFLFRVNAAGTALAFSTFIGGLGDESKVNTRLGGLAIDQAGNIYVAGYTASADFPTTSGALQTRYSGYASAEENAGEGFLVKIDPSRDPVPVAVTPQDRVITTIAGGGTVGAAISGPATNAAIGYIDAMTLHPSGAVVFASHGCGGATIIGTHIIPGGCSAGPIRSVSPDGFIRVVAGATTGTFGSGDGGPAEKAVLDITSGLASDAAGNIYICEGVSNRVWKVDTNGIINRIAGTGKYEICPNCGDGGPARDARLADPHGLAVDRLGNLYIADTFNHRVRKVTPDGTITTIAGGGSVDFPKAEGGPALQAKMQRPTAVAVDDAGNLYVLHAPNDGVGQAIRKVTPAGVITTVGGAGVAGYNGDARPAVGARLGANSNIALAANGEIYIADQGNNRIRRIDRNGMIWSVAGTLGAGSSGDNGPGELAQLDGPRAIAFDAEGNLYIAEESRIRKLGVPRALPRFDAGGVVATAGYRPGAVIARGSIFTIFGADMGPAQGVATPGYPLGAWLSDVVVRVTQGAVTVNAIPLYVSAGQINAIMPSDAPLGEVQLQVLYAGYPSASATVKVVPTNFQFFVADDPGAGVFQTVASPTDYRLCTRAEPARPGQTVIGWGSGLGAGAVADTLSPPAAGLPVDVEVSVGGKQAQVLYRGRAPGFAGVDNLYFVIPGDAPAGCQVPVQVRAGGVDGEPVTIPISAVGPCADAGSTNSSQPIAR